MAYEKKLIEGCFPCQEVGAETKRERGASSSLPPLYFLHVWWARRPLTPSRAAVLGSILPADTDPEVFLRELGIVKKQAVIGEQRWTLVGKNLDLIDTDGVKECLCYSAAVQKALTKEIARRAKVCNALDKLIQEEPMLKEDAVLLRWRAENEPFDLHSTMQATFPVETVTADPAHINERIAFCESERVVSILGQAIKIDPEDLYGYGRAYETPISTDFHNVTVLDPTSGGGSIPFEALRLGCNVIANDLNPVATAIEKATIEFPAKYGVDLLDEIKAYGDKLRTGVETTMAPYYHFEPAEIDQTGLLYCRVVTCPNCGEEAPLLNAYALDKHADGWMVLPKIEGTAGHKHVRFIPTRLVHGKGPNGEDPEVGSVKLGTGTCIHCGQAITSEEIKRQACGESQYGTWHDELYTIAAVRQQQKLDKDGKPMFYTSGANKGKPRMEKVTFFREPTDEDYAALKRAEQKLNDNWAHWEELDLIPTEKIPEGHKTAEPLRVGVERWCDMFTPRQLLGHLTAMQTLHDMIPGILAKHGQEKGTAIVTYLQYMIDKCIDYSSKQTRWHYSRGVLVGSFGRHDFSLKWSFGELIYTGPHSGLQWGIDQVIDAYRGICALIPENRRGNINVINGSAANMAIAEKSVDVVCFDPPYYNNVQYAELSDYFYVWQKRTFRDLYPDVFGRRLTNKNDEAVANPVRDGSASAADASYEARMGEIFAECNRVLKDDGILTIMFTHKTQEAWQTLTRALIEHGWIISASFPVDSEASASLHQKDMAAAASSIFLACRKRDMTEHEPSIWSGFGNTGVVQKVRDAVRQGLENFAPLHLNAVDEMVASYGCALKVLSENWPVMDGDEQVTPIKAMREASTVVAQYQMVRLSKGRISVDDVAPEAGIVLTLFGIYGTGWFPFDDALSLSKSLNLRLETKNSGYHAEGRMLGIGDERNNRASRSDEIEGYFAPVVKKGSKLRLVMPEERNAKRMEFPQTEWDVLQGTIMAYRSGDMPVARAYLQKQAEGHEDKIAALLKVWADSCGNEELQKEANRILFGLK